MSKKSSSAIPDFPPGLPRPALRALNAAGYSRLDQLKRAREEDLLKLHGFGPKALRLLREAFASRGQSSAKTRQRSR